MRLRDRIALVTGSANGIGRAVAVKLAQEGAHVVVNDIPSQQERAEIVCEEIKQIGRGSMVILADVSKTDEVHRMAESVLEKFGRLDILVNNAGLARPVRVADMTDEQWDIVINTCLRGTFLCSRAFIKTMMLQKSGKILNLASNSIWSIWPGFGQYAAAKAGIVAFTKVLALEMAEYRVNVNAIAPGFTGTEGALVRSGAEHARRMEREIPLGRIGSTEDLMGAVMLLVSDEGNFITGETILVAGGYTFRG
jgi:NAD(P)-dependent dehydrogenase (short-subunit alcohol dehydrogenase family)